MLRNLFFLPFLAACTSAFALEPDVLYEKLSPSVWVVYPYDGEGVKMGSGSGVVIGREQMVTNCHVLAKAKSIGVRRRNTAHKARLLFADTERDLCLLKVTDMDAPAVPIAPLSSVKVGERAIALGAPRGYELTLSDGLVSALARDDDDAVKQIQISVPISPGSSGGGLFDMSGRLIGITNAILLGAENVNFAIPAEWINSVPKRAEAALARLHAAEAETRETPKSVSAQGGTGSDVVTDKQQVMGSDLVAHFTRLGVVQAIGNTGSSYTFELVGGRGFNLTNLSNHSRASGIYSIEEGTGQICLMPNVSGNSGWKMWKDCYRLYDLGGDKFILRAISGDRSLAYTRN